jgi:hypothetical protein
MYGLGQKFEEKWGLMRASSFGIFVFFYIYIFEEAERMRGNGWGFVCIWNNLNPII